MGFVADNYRRVLDNVNNAEAKANMKQGSIELIAVTKFVDEERIAEAINAGAYSVGENRAQEFVKKLSLFNSCNVHKNLIGQLQTNKVKYVIGDVDLIQSVDRLSLATEIDRLARDRGIIQNVLVEVNIGAESQKGGADTDSLSTFLSKLSTLDGLRVSGLMCIPPAVDKVRVRSYFAAMRDIYLDIKEKKIPGISMDILSMGMSNDYEEAILEGATMVRVGTAIFGARQASN